MIKSQLVILSCFLCFVLTAQKQGNIWYFGVGAGLDFNSGIPTPLTNGVLNTQEGCASVCDNNGILLFYTDGQNVYNKNHTLMPNGTGLNGGSSSTQSAIIVPKPGNANIYYIFTSSGGIAGVCYSEVDMTLNGGLGAVTATKNVLLNITEAEKVTAICHQNGNDYWVITADNYFTNNVYSYLVSSAGVTSVPVVSSAGSIPFTNRLGYIKGSHDGKILAQAVTYMDTVDVMHFNNATGTVTPWFSIGYPLGTACYGVEFSPDNSKLYVTFDADNKVVQYDLSSNVPNTIITTSVVVGLLSTNDVGAIQMGPDKKLYITTYDTLGLSSISNPNALGAACGFSLNNVPLAGRHPQLGLPNFISCMFNAAPINYTNTCSNAPTNFWIDNTDLASVQWNFGDPTSGINNSSVSFTTTHTYSLAGTYTVNAITTSSTGITNTLTSLVNIESQPTFNLGIDTTLCNDNSTFLSVNSTYTNVTWNNGATTNSIVINVPGKYWAIVQNQCGITTDTINLKPKNCDVINRCGELFLANAFSPNNDGNNDVFCAKGGIECINEISLYIYNRWGEKVFESFNVNTCWDGNYHGKPLDTGVFAYYVQAIFANGEKVIKQGNITLIK